jgi:hypothetical protein
MGYILDKTSTIMCMHGGQAQAQNPNMRVKVGGNPVVCVPGPHSISGCSMPPPSAGNGPCTTAMWSSGATRVKAGGMAVLTKDSQATCVPTGTGVQITVTQMRVKAQ